MKSDAFHHDQVCPLIPLDELVATFVSVENPDKQPRSLDFGQG